MADVLIGITGVCSSGKTTLANGLRAHGFNARQISQEHSYVPDMWRRLTAPDILIYLDASLETIRRRRESPEWPRRFLERETERLRHARTNADLSIQTDDLTPEAVLTRVLDLLAARGLKGP